MSKCWRRMEKRSKCANWTRTCSARPRSWVSTSAGQNVARMRKTVDVQRKGDSDGGCQRVRSASDRICHSRLDPRMVQRRGEEARDHQLPNAPSGKGRPLLRKDLWADQGLGVQLREVQAGPLQGDHLRTLRGR